MTQKGSPYIKILDTVSGVLCQKFISASNTNVIFSTFVSASIHFLWDMSCIQILDNMVVLLPF